MALTNAQLQSISQNVYQKFPELKGASPVVQSQSAPGAKSTLAANRFVVIFKTTASHPVQRVVRVTVDAGGKILKISTSR